MDRLRSMAVFVRVAELGGLSKAARNLNLSAAGVSQHISALERWLGARLLHRTTRRVALTEAGRNFLRHARQVLEQVDAAQTAAASLHIEPRGLLRISVPITYGIRSLGPVIADYLVENPKVQIDAVAEDRVVDLVAEGFDLAVRIGRPKDSSLVAQKIAPSPMILCAAQGYLQRHGEPQTPRELSRHACLEYSLRPTPGRWRLIGSDGTSTVVAVSGPLTSTNGEILRAAALKGLGVMLAPAFIVGDDVRRGALKPVLGGYRFLDAGVYAVRPPSPYITPKVRTFVAFLKRRLSPRRA